MSQLTNIDRHMYGQSLETSKERYSFLSLSVRLELMLYMDDE